MKVKLKDGAKEMDLFYHGTDILKQNIINIKKYFLNI
jgi:hypothetical protein